MKNQNTFDKHLANGMQSMLDRNGLTIADLVRRTGLNRLTVEKCIGGNLKTAMLNYVAVCSVMGEEFHNIYWSAKNAK